MTITCKICNKEFKSIITASHLKRHNISCSEYRSQYGTMVSDEQKQKRLNTMFEKYGAFVSPKTREASRDRAADLNIKGRITVKQKYGVDNVGQLPGHADKIKETYKGKFGVDHYTKTEEYKAESEINRFRRWVKFSPKTVELLDIGTAEDKVDMFENPNKMISFKCLLCNGTEEIPSETYKWRIRQADTPCIKCSGINKGSLKEQSLKDFVISLGFNIVENRKLLGKQEIDIFIPEKNIGIEFNGLFWHNDLRVDKKYHIDKTVAARNNGIRLIHIFEDEWDHARPIVESRLRGILGKIDNRIYARKCEIKEISYKDEKQFLESTHMQGYAKSSVKLGLFHDGILVSVMTFAKANLAKGHRNSLAWELLRFSSIKNTVVVGAASRLFSYFIKTYSPVEVISYSDNRWNTGNTYKNIGFQPNGDTGIGYWYILGDKRIHRFNLRKTKDDDQTKTEYENRLTQGYKRIWDCGHSKWIWRAPLH